MGKNISNRLRFPCSHLIWDECKWIIYTYPDIISVGTGHLVLAISVLLGERGKRNYIGVIIKLHR